MISPSGTQYIRTTSQVAWFSYWWHNMPDEPWHFNSSDPGTQPSLPKLVRLQEEEEKDSIELFFIAERAGLYCTGFQVPESLLDCRTIDRAASCPVFPRDWCWGVRRRWRFASEIGHRTQCIEPEWKLDNHLSVFTLFHICWSSFSISFLPRLLSDETDGTFGFGWISNIPAVNIFGKQGKIHVLFSLWRH